MTESLGTALPKEMERVRGILPYYDEIPTGVFAATMMRETLAAAEKAQAEGDVVAMMRLYQDLKGYTA